MGWIGFFLLAAGKGESAAMNTVSVIPQDFRPSRRWNRLRNGEPWRPSDYEEERMRNIARNQELLRKLRLEPYEGNPSPVTKVNCEPLRKSDKIHGDLQVSRPSPGSYREKRMHNIATNKEMLRKLFEGNSPLLSPLPSPKRQKAGKSIMGPGGPTKYMRGQESAGPAFETPGGTALAILRRPGGNAERPLGVVWGTPAAFVQLLAWCGMSLNPAAVNDEYHESLNSIPELVPLEESDEEDDAVNQGTYTSIDGSDCS